MNYSTWLKRVIIITLIICSPYLYIAIYNFYIDPLWNFTHSNKHNQYQVPFDERQQKTNMITGNNFDYDALIIGTSRSTYINQHEIKDFKTFNYSVSSMHIKEYNDYIEYAKKQNGKDFKVIYLEVFPKHLDFPKTFEEPTVYINKANDNFYKLKSLFSFDTYERAKNNYELSVHPENIGNRSYNRKNIAIAKVIDKAEAKKNANIQLEEITLPKKYKKNKEYKKLLQEIKDNNPNTKFVLYSTPYFSERFYKEFEGEIGYKIYEDWLKDCVEVFGEVNNFLYVNSVSENISNYFDSHHFYPEVGTLIAHKISGKKDNNIPADFGVIVNKENINEHLKMIKNQLQEQ